MKKIVFVLFSFLLSINVMAKITVEFIPNTVKQGDAVELVLSSDTNFSGVPNINILQKDFIIGGQQQRQSAQWINGKGHTVYQLIYTLFPNRSGMIKIQGLKVGNEVVPEISLSVHDDGQHKSNGEIVLSVVCPKETVYPAQRLLCHVNIEDKLGLVDGQIFAPQTETGIWEQVVPPMPIGNGQSGVRQYQSVFAFTPKTSGVLIIPPFTLQGQVRVSTGARRYDNLFDLMFMNIQSQATRPISIQGKPFELTVKEKPADYIGWWLPSVDVQLTESYQLPDNLMVGAPISRTLTLTAQDVLADNMPVPEAVSSNGLKVYTNPEKRQDTVSGGQVMVTLTFVPTQEGEVTLPAIRVPWFNTQTEKIEDAVVPAKTVFVMGGGAVPAAPVAPKDVSDSLNEPIEVKESASVVTVKAAFPWTYLILGCVLAFCCGLLIAFICIRHFSVRSEHKKKKPLPDLYPF